MLKYRKKTLIVKYKTYEKINNWLIYESLSIKMRSRNVAETV